MKPRTTRILAITAITVGALILAIAACAGWYLSKMKAETALMCPDPTGEVLPGVAAVRQDYSDSWFIRGSDGWIAIDAGMDPKALAAGMAQLGIDPAQVKAILLTHSDYDHAGGLPALAGVPLYLGADEEAMVNGTTARSMFIHNGALPAHRLLADGQTLELAGLKVGAMHLPGHTPGSTAYLIGDGRLFTGDALAITNGRMTGFNAFFNMDCALAARSQEKLRGLAGVTAVFTAHYGHSADPATLFAAAP